MWIVCLADNSWEMSRLIFSGKKLEFYLLQILLGALRVNTELQNIGQQVLLVFLDSWIHDKSETSVKAGESTKNINEDTQDPQSQSTAFQRTKQRKDEGQTMPRHSSTDANIHTKKTCNRETALEWPTQTTTHMS